MKVKPTGPARPRAATSGSPITGGSIDPATAAGTIDHRGGLRLKAGKVKVKLDNYRVKVGAQDHAVRAGSAATA